MKKLFGAAWLVIGLAAVGWLGYEVITSWGESPNRINVTTTSIPIYIIPCSNSRGEEVPIIGHRHEVFVQRKVQGLTHPWAEKKGPTIMYDSDLIENFPLEYREFVLYAACARKSQPDPLEAECTAVKKLRDEKSYSRQQVVQIAEQISSDASAEPAEKSSRTRNLYACFDAPK